MELKSTYGNGFIAGLDAKAMEMENQADEAYALAMPSALGVQENKYSALFKERGTKNARETIVSKTGVNRMLRTGESEDFNVDDRSSGYRVELNPVKFTQSVEISKDLLEDMDADLQSKFDEIRDLKIGYMQGANLDAFSDFVCGFTAQASLPDHLSFYADGVPLFSASHPIKSSTSSNTTQSNYGTDAFSETNLETARLAVANQKDDRDMLGSWGSGNVILLAPTALEKNAVIVTKSTKRSGSATNDLNVYDGLVTVMSTKLLGSTITALGTSVSGTDGSWFLIDSMKSPFIFLNREGFTPDTWQDKKNKNYIYDAEARYTVGHKTWRGTYGNYHV
jgi:hypothetical protein